MAKVTTAAVTPNVKGSVKGRPKRKSKARPIVPQATSEKRGLVEGVVPEDDGARDLGSNEEDDTVTVTMHISDPAVNVDLSDEQSRQPTHTTTPALADTSGVIHNEMPSSNTRSAGKLRRPVYAIEMGPRQKKLPPQRQSNRSNLVSDPSGYREDLFELQATPESKTTGVRPFVFGHNEFSPTKQQKRALKRRAKTHQQEIVGTPSQIDAIQADRQLRQEEGIRSNSTDDATHGPNAQQDRSVKTSVSPQTSRKRKREELKRQMTSRTTIEKPSGSLERPLSQAGTLQSPTTTAIESLLPGPAFPPTTNTRSGEPEVPVKGILRKSTPQALLPVRSKSREVDDTATHETANARPVEQIHSPKAVVSSISRPQQAPTKSWPLDQSSVSSPLDQPVREGQGKDKLSIRGSHLQESATHLRQARLLKNARIVTEQPEQQLKITQLNPDEVLFEEQQEEGVDASEESEHGEDEYWHHYPLLHDFKGLLGKALGGVLIFEKESEITFTLADDQTKAIVELCKEIRRQLTGIRDGTEGDNEPANNLVELDARLSAIQGKKNMADTQTNTDRSCDIYAIVIPCLVKLLCHQRNCYIQIDQEKRKNAHRPLSIGHVDTLLKTVNMVFRFVDSAQYYPRIQFKKRRAKGSTEESQIKFREYCAVDVRPNLRAAVGTLMKMRKEFAEDARLANQLRELEQTQRIHALQQEMARRLKAVENVRERWRCLHEERRAAEGGFLAIWARGRQDAFDSLRDPDYWPHELDSNGEPFERLEVFSQRSGPPPLMVEKARARYWSAEQIQTLGAGLKRFAEECGPDNPDLMLVKIFRSYCYQRGPLVDFNVTEIVTKAADLKAFFIEKGYQGDWIEAIPDWVRPLRLEGVENGQ